MTAKEYIEMKKREYNADAIILQARSKHGQIVALLLEKFLEEYDEASKQ